MIIDLQKFITTERPFWTELERILNRMENEPHLAMGLEEVRRFHYLYERTSADLGKLVTFASEPETRRYLESLVARAYAEIHETREREHRFKPMQWFFSTFPQAFRRHVRAFWLSLLITFVGCLFGGFAIAFDPESKAVIMPFPHLLGSPAERVAMEEKASDDRMNGAKSTFSATLMTHNTKVAILAMSLGMTWAFGTMVLLFYNGVILGAVAVDYILAGQTKFLAGWLLPHGSFEIPAILIAGQAGLILGGALIGWGKRASLRQRFRDVSHDLVTLICGVAILLVWAGIVESFFSQYHAPVLPYWLKIAFGSVQLFLLMLFLAKGGSKVPEQQS